MGEGGLSLGVARLPEISCGVLADLCRGLVRGGRVAMVRGVERAEELASEIEEGREYPEEWVVFRVTGERAAKGHGKESGGLGVTHGGALLRDLSAFAETLSAAAGLTREECPGAVSGLDWCAARGVGKRTLQRLLREGLVARRCAGEVVLMPGVLARFEARHAGRLSGLRGVARMGREEQEEIAREAWALQERGHSRSEAAKRIAVARGRSHEGIRRVLERVARGGAVALREDPGVMGEGRRRVLVRAARSGVSVARLAARYEKSAAAVRRGVVLGRAEALRGVLSRGELAGAVGPTFEFKDAREVLLGHPAVTHGLGGGGVREVRELIEEARRSSPPSRKEEQARSVAVQFLKFDAARRIAGLDRLHPGAGEVDRIETDLRWAARLMAELLRTQLRLVIDTIDARVGRAVEQLPASEVVELLDGALRASAGAVGHFDPFRGGRLAGVVGIAVDRFAAGAVRAAPGKRAAVVLGPGVRIADWTMEVASWQRRVEPRERVVEAARRGREAWEVFLAARYGFAGAPPRTLREMATERGVSGIRVAREEQRAVERAVVGEMGRERVTRGKTKKK